MQYRYSITAQEKKEYKTSRKERIQEPPELPCNEERVHALLDTWIKDNQVKLPYVEKMPMTKDKKHALYC